MGADGLAVDFEAVETAAKRLCGGSDQSCGGVARYAGRRPKTFTTALSEMELERAWYRTLTGLQSAGPGAGPGRFTSLSPAALRMTGLAAARVSFAETGALLRELAGLVRVERQAEALGREIAHDERQVIEPANLPRWRHRRCARPRPKVATASSPTAPPRPARPKSSRSADTTALARPRLRLLQRRLVCRQPRYRHRALPLRPSRRSRSLPRQVVLGDGAPWIWNWADEHLPAAIQIVDVFHAKQHLFDVAKAIYGAATDLALLGKTTRIDQGRFDDLRPSMATTPGNASIRNRQRMRYPAFRTIGRLHRRRRGRLQEHRRHPPAAACTGPSSAPTLSSILSNRFDFWERRTIAK